VKSIINMGRLLGVCLAAAALLPQGAKAQSNIVTYPTATDMAIGRNAHRMMPLPDGRLILQGDVTAPTAGTNTVEVYNPDARNFQRLGRLLITRWQDASAVLADGRLLVVGGRTNLSNLDVVASAELLDPATGITVPTGSLNFPRTLARAVTLQDGRVLVFGGTGVNGFSVASAELYDPATGQFTVCGATTVNRPVAQEISSATVLQDGRVLVFGSGGTPTSGAELFNPATGTFQSAGAVVLRRTSHSATLLPDGRVVIIGGIPSGVPNAVTNLVEVYNPATATFSVMGNILQPRRSHTATLLPDGRILVAGGWPGGIAVPPAIAAMEIFDPFTGTSEYIGDMAARRADHRVTALANGQLIITGGRSEGPFLRTAEVFDPLIFMRPEDLYAFYQEFANLTLENQQLWQLYNQATNVIWGLAMTNSNLQAELTYANEIITEQQAQLDELQPNPFRLLPQTVPLRLRLRGFTLDDERVLLLPTVTTESPASRLASVFDPRTESFSNAGIINDARSGLTANRLSDNRILVAGGSVQSFFGTVPATNSTEIYSFNTTNSVPGPSMAFARVDGFSVNLAGGRILIMGGRNAATNFVAQSEIYEPASNSFRASGVMPGRVVQASVTPLLDGRVLIFGLNTGTVAVAHLFDPATETFMAVSGASVARLGHQTSLLADGRVMISGGRAGGAGPILSSTEIFDPATGTFTMGPSMLTARLNFTATTMQNGTVLIAGGQTNTLSTIPATLEAEIYDPATDSFSAAGTMMTNQFNHAAVLLQNGTVLFSGGSSGTPSMYVNRAQIYDPMQHVPTSQLGNLHLLIDDLEAENDDLAAQLASLQAALANANTTISGLVVTNAQLQQELAACEAEKAALTMQINALTNQIAQLQGTITTLTAQNNALTNQVAQQQTTINSLVGQNSALTNQVAILTQQNAQQAALIASLQAQNSSLTNQVATLTQQNSQLQTALTTTQGHVQSLMTAFQTEFNDPTFVIPGATLEQQVQNLINAILGLNHGQQQALYNNLE
jgi:hypothetical protein